ncbi:hypothetical protein [Microbulbifer halophilus]|uniref:Uncharacterized protein n=1 Tax=Microbulbifer halophilus TaxID=453963 RepID=A0ABW5EGJ5_9GAMM|nr:hypothetical protein [Microbulbifer halophilus]MCW8127030.1 hypothetical protein [Microbulbifer halophilus]
MERAYREYARLSATCNDYIRRALGDIRLFGAIAALLAWDPLSRLLELDARLQQPVTPVGFLVLLLVMALVMFFDLFKQSIFFFHLQRMRELERMLNRTAEGDTPLFHLAGGWPAWFHHHHAPIARIFWGIFYLLVVAFPSAILYLQDYAGWLPAYLGTACLVLFLHARCALKLLHSLDEQL